MGKIKELIDAVFKTPTVEDATKNLMVQSAVEVAQHTAAIEKARFQRHMALCTMRAVQDWNAGRVVENLKEVTP